MAESGWAAPVVESDGVRYVRRENGSSISYPEEGFDVLGLDGGGGYWFDHRAATVSRRIERLGISTMWEIGAGTGVMAHQLRSVLRDVVTVEPMEVGAQAAARLGLTSLCGTLEDLRLPESSIESIGAFDVVEHVEHPGPLLMEMHRVLRPGGVAIATAPALRALWGSEDDVAGHHRRYRRSTLAAEFASRGFVEMHSEYLYATLVPPAFFLRALPYRLGRRASKEAVLESLRKQLTVGRMTDRIARVVLNMESALAKAMPLPFGLSVLGVFTKPG